MTAPVIDRVATTAPAVSDAATKAEAEAKAADMLTFQIGMTTLAVVLVLMAVIGAVAASPALIITAGLLGSVTAMAGIYTGLSIATR